MLLDINKDEYIIHEATNGISFVELCIKHQPDVAFVDITMPKLDGLSAIKRCMEFSPNTQYIVLTGHSEFKFAQEAINLKISNYIVKPIEVEKLINLMDELSDNLYSIRQHQNMSFQLSVINSFQMWDEIGYIEMPRVDLPKGNNVYAFNFFIDCRPSTNAYSNTYKSLIEETHLHIRKFIDVPILYAFLDRKDGSLQLIVSCDNQTILKLRKEIDQIAGLLSNSSILVSNVVSYDINLWNLYAKLKIIKEHEYLRFGLKSHQVDDFSTIKFSDSEKHFLFSISQCIDSFREVNESSYMKYFICIKNTDKEKLKNIDLDYLMRFTCHCLGSKTICTNFRNFIKFLGSQKERMYTDGNITPKNKITNILGYIDKHYMDDISIVLLAEKEGISPNYFSKIFHESVGETFSMYLTNIRISNAKRILKSNPDILVKDVALKVGYISTRHFSSVFKNITGVYPSDYK